MKKNLPYILIAIILIIAGFFAYKSYRSNKSYPSYSDDKQTSKETQQALQTAQSQMQKPEEQNNYTHPDPNFSFQYPKTMNATSFEEGEGETILVQFDASYKSNTSYQSYPNLAFQIYISDFDEDITLTAERIKKDLPDTVINQPKSISVGNITATAFLSSDESLGQTYEVWLVYNKHLYQILSYASQKDLVDKILATWSWQ